MTTGDNQKEIDRVPEPRPLDITDAQVAAALDALTALEGALAGLISLDNEERRSLT